jgi:hypothetical protein
MEHGLKSYVRGKAVPLHTMKACGESRNLAPIILLRLRYRNLSNITSLCSKCFLLHNLQVTLMLFKGTNFGDKDYIFY